MNKTIFRLLPLVGFLMLSQSAGAQTVAELSQSADSQTVAELERKLVLAKEEEEERIRKYKAENELEIVISGVTGPNLMLAGIFSTIIGLSVAALRHDYRDPKGPWRKDSYFRKEDAFRAVLLATASAYYLIRSNFAIRTQRPNAQPATQNYLDSEPSTTPSYLQIDSAKAS